MTWWWNRGEKMCEWSEGGCILRIILRPKNHEAEEGHGKVV